MTLDQAKQYLSSIGVTFPDFVIEAIIEQMKEKEDCLNANYSPSAVLLIYCYLLALIGGAQSGMYVSSQAISGAVSRSFNFKDSGVLFRSQLALLRALDKKGCVSDLIPEDPFKVKKGFITSVTGGCYE